MSKVLIISADCHAGALPATYEAYMPKAYHEAARAWWLEFVREMMHRAGTFFDQDAVEAYTEEAGGGRGLMDSRTRDHAKLGDDEVLRMLSDSSSPFAPRPGEFDADVRAKDLDADGIAGEVVFPQMVPFGGGLIQYRRAVPPEHNLEGLRAYNRWLAELCSAHPGRHAGVALINVDDIDTSVQEIRSAKEMGLWGGVLLPTSTGEHPFYHHPRYEPLWAVCEELDMPLHSHSGWSPDYGEVESATAMYISEVDMWAHRPFTALMWSGAFERHPGLRLVLTETGCSWILETLRLLEYKADLPIFKYFTRDLSLRPSEYFARQCYIGASFMPPNEGEDRHRIGLDKLMWGTDYPHLEGTWPNTMHSLRETFAAYPEEEIRALLGTNAAGVYGFDLDLLTEVAERIGPELSDIRGGTA
jgi:predicted TIM-barrel fold metal-dependent hydrolase